jgi:hypothetical protein
MFTQGTEHEGFSFFYFISSEGKIVSINAINPQKERRCTTPLIPRLGTA